MLNLRKKLLVSIFTLMLALVAVSTTTYAWFTLGNVAEISGIEMEVQGADGLTIRVAQFNAKSKTALGGLYNWATSHDLSKYTEVPSVVMKPLSMVSGLGAASGDGTLSEITGVTVDGSATYKAIESGSESNLYIEITFDFRSEAANTVVTFNDLQASFIEGYKSHSFITPINVPKAGSVTADVAAGSSVSKARLANSLRVAYKSGEKYIVINPKHYDTDGEQYGQWGGTALAYFNELSGKTPLTVAAPYQYSAVEPNTIELVTLAREESNTGDVSFYTGSVTLLIWLEGWDADCFNAIAFDHASFSVSFGTIVG